MTLLHFWHIHYSLAFVPNIFNWIFQWEACVNLFAKIIHKENEKKYFVDFDAQHRNHLLSLQMRITFVRCARTVECISISNQYWLDSTTQRKNKFRFIWTISLRIFLHGPTTYISSHKRTEYVVRKPSLLCYIFLLSWNILIISVILGSSFRPIKYSMWAE